MKPVSYFAVTGQQVATHPVKVIKLEATLNASATAGLYLLVHDSIVTPAEGAAPLKSWPAIECGYKEFELGELVLNAGLYVCLSTTAATKTLATGGSDKCDILNIELTDPEQPTGTSTAGDLTTACKGLLVWADGSPHATPNSAKGPHRLLRVEVDNSGGAASYLMLFAGDSPANGDKPIDQFKLAAATNYLGGSAFTFGKIGRDVFSQDSSGVNHDGCTLKVSSTAGTLTLISGNDVKLKAEYK